MPRSSEGRHCFWLEYVTLEGGVRASPIDAIEAGAEGINARGHPVRKRSYSQSDSSEGWANDRKSGSVGLLGYDGKAPASYVVEVGAPHACYAILEHTRGGWCATIRYVPPTRHHRGISPSKGMLAWAERDCRRLG